MTFTTLQAAMIGGILGLLLGAHIPLYLIDPPYRCADHRPTLFKTGR